MSKNMKPIQGSICLYALVALLAGCSKPPGCADPETVAVTRSLLADKVLKSAADDPWAEGDAMRANDPEGLLAKFIEGVTVNLNAVTTSGYDAKSKRHMCEGTLLVAAEGESLSIPVEYSTQATENGKGDFLLRMSQTGLIVPGLRGKAWRYWQSRRYVGTGPARMHVMLWTPARPGPLVCSPCRSPPRSMLRHGCDWSA